MSLHRSPEEIAANRARYEEHQRKGLEFAPKALPGPSPRPAPGIAAAAMIADETVPGGWYFGTPLQRGEALRIAQTGSHASVALVAWRAEDPSERLNLPDTIKVQWTTEIGRGRVLFSDMGRVMLSVIEDSSGAHDVLAGGSTRASTEARYGETRRNTRDNLILAATKFGLGRRDIPASLNLFAPVRVAEDGSLFWRGDLARGDDYVTLRAEMNLLVALSNCPHPLDPTPDFAPPPIEVTRFTPGPAAGDDICRSASAEAVRGFENTARLLA